MRIGVYGGTFNPIHRGHLTAARAAADALGLEKVLLIPDNLPPHKELPAGSATGEDRLAMCRLTAGEVPGMEVLDLELRRSGPSYTSDTLAELHAQYPDDELWLLVGSDMFLSLQEWHEPERILSLAGIAAFHRTCGDETERFARDVMDHFVAEYCAGHTPNPCIDCNRCLKFGALLDRALLLGYDYIATGHYARVERDGQSGRWRLLRGRDRHKDQSYVLYQLTQYQLAHLLLPVGEFDKPTIRGSAREAGLLNADKADSQDICFVPDGDYVSFLRDYGHVELTPGDFVDREGRVLGRHKGLPCYTTGQRKGLGVSAGKHVYVVRKNAADNTILLGDNADLFTDTLTARDVNWISGETPPTPVRCTAKTRYSQTEAACTAAPLPDGRLCVTFDEPQRAITCGQSVVLYDGDRVLGGGTIDSVK